MNYIVTVTNIQSSHYDGKNPEDIKWFATLKCEWGNESELVKAEVSAEFLDKIDKVKGRLTKDPDYAN